MRRASSNAGDSAIWLVQTHGPMQCSNKFLVPLLVLSVVVPIVLIIAEDTMSAFRDVNVLIFDSFCPGVTIMIKASQISPTGRAATAPPRRKVCCRLCELASRSRLLFADWFKFASFFGEQTFFILIIALVRSTSLASLVHFSCQIYLTVHPELGARYFLLILSGVWWCELFAIANSLTARVDQVGAAEDGVRCATPLLVLEQGRGVRMRPSKLRL